MRQIGEERRKPRFVLPYSTARNTKWPRCPPPIGRLAQHQRCSSICYVRSMKALHHHGNPLPPANASRSQPILLPAPPQFVQQRNHQPRSRRSQRMPQRDSTTVHIHFLAIESQFFLDRQVLGRKRLVDFDQIDVVQRQPGPLQSELGGGHWPPAHQLGIHACDAPVHDPSQRAQVPLLGLLQRHHDHGRTAIDDPASVPRRNRPILSKRRPQLGEPFHRGLRTPVIILRKHLGLTLPIFHRYRNNLLRQTPFLVSSIRRLLGPQRELILHLASDPLLLAVKLS